MSYNVVVQNCKSKGKQLLEPRTKKEQTKLTTYMIDVSINDVWIGVSRQQSPDSPPWVWRYESDQTIVEKHFWNPGEPNNSQSSEQCVENWTYGDEKQWSDVPCSKKFMSICVKPGYNQNQK